MDRKYMPFICLVMYVVFALIGIINNDIFSIGFSCSMFVLANIEANHLELLKKLDEKK